MIQKHLRNFTLSKTVQVGFITRQTHVEKCWFSKKLRNLSKNTFLQTFYVLFLHTEYQNKYNAFNQWFRLSCLTWNVRSLEILQVNSKGKADGNPLTNEFPVLYNTHVNKTMYLEYPPLCLQSTSHATRNRKQIARQVKSAAEELGAWKVGINWFVTAMNMLQILHIFSLKPFRKKYHSLS